MDDGYRILLLHPQGDKQYVLPTHLPRTQHNAAACHFLRLHCRYSLDFALRRGDISDDYSNWTITAAMSALGMDYYGNDDPDAADREVAPLSDPQGQTALGKVISRHVFERRTAEALGGLGASTSPADSGLCDTNTGKLWDAGGGPLWD
ncbi:hypothetical protein B0H19DRAFT_1245523 [Mycena capillaripes]|nr:hypothetical protein B0H19DRAFT_1245523 [Mycena capillaripes]